MDALRRSRRVASSGHPGDDAQLRRVDTERLQGWRHYLYCRDERGCRAAAEEVRAAGWTVVSAGRSVDLPAYVLIAERSEVPTAATATTTRAWWEALAVRIDGGRYDGWEGFA